MARYAAQCDHRTELSSTDLFIVSIKNLIRQRLLPKGSLNASVVINHWARLKPVFQLNLSLLRVIVGLGTEVIIYPLAMAVALVELCLPFSPVVYQQIYPRTLDMPRKDPVMLETVTTARSWDDVRVTPTNSTTF